MSSKVTFTNAELDSFQRTRQGGTATFRAPLTSAVIKSMGWGDMPDSWKGATPEGDLAASTVELSPNDKELRKAGIQLDTTRVNGFKLIRLEAEGTRGSGFRREIRFVVYFADPNGAQKLEGYMLGAGKSRLVVSYEKQPVQGELGTEATEDQRQAVLSEQ